MKLTGLECPSCGAKLSVNEQNPTQAVCEYCGSTFAVEWDHDQAYFDRSGQDKTPKTPEKDRKNGWESGGWKRNTLVSVLGVVCLILLRVPRIYNRWQAGRNRPSVEKAFSFDNSSLPAMDSARDWEIQEEEDPEENREETEPQKASLTGRLEAIAVQAFGKPAEQITQQELSQIQWIETRWDLDGDWIGYSFEDPFSPQAELTWLLVSPESASGKEGLRFFTNLKKVNLDLRLRKEDIQGLALTSIGGYFSDIDEVVQLVDDPKQIRELQFTSGLDSLEGIEVFSNLESLAVSGSSLADISYLVNMPSLRKLTLEDFDSLADYSVLGTMKGIEELSISSENLKVLDFVKNMDSLKKLEILEGDLLSLDGIEMGKNLTSVRVEDCYNLKQVDALSALTSLTELSLELPYGCKNPDLSGFSSLLHLELSQVDDCSFLTGLTQLETLELSGCSLETVPDLGGFTNLREITCHAFMGLGQDLGFMNGLTGLEKLDLEGMSTYDDISGLFNLESLRELNISGMECEIAFDRIEENHSLEILKMDGVILYENAVVTGGGGMYNVYWDDVVLDGNTGFLGRFKALRELSIAENELTDIDFASELTALEKIDLSENYVTQLRPLSGLAALRQVICRGNPVSNERVLGDKVMLIME